MSFEILKSKAGAIAGIQQQIAKSNNSYANPLDDISWKSEPDKVGNARAIIRFLPASEGEESPFVKMFSHGFRSESNPKAWFIENCVGTIGGECAVCKDVSELYDTGIESNKKKGADRKRKLSFYSNIIVISDPKNPQNEYANCGKVFVFRYGKKIFEKIVDKISPTFEDDVPFDPFDMWTGANFTLTTKKVEGFPNYDSSTFAEPKPLFDGDEAQMEELYYKQHKLETIISADKFKSEEEIATKYAKFIGVPNKPSHTEDDEDVASFKSNKPTFTKKKVDEDDDDSLDYSKLLEEID